MTYVADPGPAGHRVACGGNPWFKGISCDGLTAENRPGSRCSRARIAGSGRRAGTLPFKPVPDLNDTEVRGGAGFKTCSQRAGR